METLENYLKKAPEITFEWHDAETGATGWCVINSLKGGAAGGGTRMRPGLTKQEVLELAKTMEIKFSVCGPAIGGGKSGIDFDPNDPRKKQVLERWFRAIKPLLAQYYGTGGDLNVDERADVTPILEQIGLFHPQQGVLSGHFALDQDESIKRLHQLKKGTSLFVRNPEFTPRPDADEFTTMDLITGYGVFASIKAYYQHFGHDNLEGKRFFIQGWGNVGAAAGWYIGKDGGQLVAIQDKASHLMNPNGLSFKEIDQLLKRRTGNHLPEGVGTQGSIPQDQLESLQIDCFVPAAASRLVHQAFVERMMANGLELISCGANVAFHEEAIIFGEVSKALDRQIAIIPDFVANCGVARLFSFLMSEKGIPEEKAIFDDVRELIEDALHAILQKAGAPRNLTATALEMYLQ